MVIPQPLSTRLFTKLFSFKSTYTWCTVYLNHTLCHRGVHNSNKWWQWSLYWEQTMLYVCIAAAHLQYSITPTSFMVAINNYNYKNKNSSSITLLPGSAMTIVIIVTIAELQYEYVLTHLALNKAWPISRYNWNIYLRWILGPHTQWRLAHQSTTEHVDDKDG